MHMSELGGLAVIGEVIGYQKQNVEGRRFVSVGPLCLRRDRSAQRSGRRTPGIKTTVALRYPPQSKRLLQVTVLAAVKAALPGRNPFLALRRDGNPVLNLCVPVQIAIINYLAFFQDPCASRGRGYCLFRLTHGAVYSLIGREKAEMGTRKGLSAIGRRSPVTERLRI